MKRQKLIKLSLVVLLMGIMVTGYGGQCPWEKDKDDDVVIGSSAPTTVSRFLYVWGAAYNMSDGLNGDDTALQDELITFCSQRGITGVFFFTDLTILDSNTDYRDALQDAISHLKDNDTYNIPSVWALPHGDTGNMKWALTANQPTFIGYVNTLLSYNETLTLGFDGLELDIEIYTDDYGWVSSQQDLTGTNGDLANQYLTLLSQVKSTISGAIGFSAAMPIPKFMDVTLPITFNGVSKPFYKHVQDICKVNLMDYQGDDKDLTVDSAEPEISYGGSVRIILETDQTGDGPVSSNQSLESIIAALQTEYSAYSSFSGVAIHYYTTYKQWFYDAFYKPIKTVTLDNQSDRHPHGVAFDPIYNTIYVAMWSDVAPYIFVLNASDYTLTTTITSSNAYDTHAAVVVSPDGRYIYTGNYYPGSVSRFDRSDSYAKTDLGLGSWTGELILSPDGSKLYVVLGTDGRTSQDTGSKIAIVNTSNFTSGGVEYVNLPEATYGESRGLVLSPDGTKLYVSAGQSNGSDNWRPRVHTVSLTSKTVVASREGYSGDCHGMDITPDGQFLFITDRPNNKVNVLSTSDLSFQYSISVGSGPIGIAISPDGNTALVCNLTDKTISQIDVSSRTVVKTIPAADMVSLYEADITFDSTGNFAYVVNYGDPGCLLVLKK